MLNDICQQPWIRFANSGVLQGRGPSIRRPDFIYNYMNSQFGFLVFAMGQILYLFPRHFSPCEIRNGCFWIISSAYFAVRSLSTSLCFHGSAFSLWSSKCCDIQTCMYWLRWCIISTFQVFIFSWTKQTGAVCHVACGGLWVRPFLWVSHEFRFYYCQC